jgi:hypothetical protein
VGFPHDGTRIVPHPLTQTDITNHDLAVFFSKTPDLVVRTRTGLHFACGIDHTFARFRVVGPDAVQPHDRAERPPLEPADQELLEFRVVNLTTGKSSDIGRPPRNAGNTHIQADTDLSS